MGGLHAKQDDDGNMHVSLFAEGTRFSYDENANGDRTGGHEVDQTTNEIKQEPEVPTAWWPPPNESVD